MVYVSLAVVPWLCQARSNVGCNATRRESTNIAPLRDVDGLHKLTVTSLARTWTIFAYRQLEIVQRALCFPYVGDVDVLLHRYYADVLN